MLRKIYDYCIKTIVVLARSNEKVFLVQTVERKPRRSRTGDTVLDKEEAKSKRMR